MLAYVTFSRKERLGIVALILLLGLIWVLPAWWGTRTDREERRLYMTLADSLAGPQLVRRVQIYPFDPNRIPDSTWLSFGVPERSVQMIRNYLQKGGRFRKPESLLSIYGIDTPIARALIPNVRIEGAGLKASPHRSSGLSQVDVTTIDPRFRKPPRQPLGQVDINRADSAELEALPWIGEKLAGRIIRFRDACGGLYAIDQLAGMYGLSDTVFLHFRPFLRLGKKELRELRINSMPVDSLVMHPYIQYRQAKALVAFRAQHGLYKNGDDLLKVAVVDSLWLERIRPYLKFD